MGRRKRLVGTVVSNKMQKTVAVQVVTYRPHPLYPKVVRKRKKYLADTGGKHYEIGDVVVIEECRPLSKRKRWRVVGLKGHLHILAEETPELEEVEKQEGLPTLEGTEVKEDDSAGDAPEGGG